MKFIAKIVSILLIPAMLLSFAACRDEDKNDNTGDPFVYNPYPYEDLGEYLQLADYKNFSISQSFIDREINLILASLFDEQHLYVDVTSGRETKEWDNIKIEFSNIVVDGKTVYPAPEDSEGEAEGSEETEENKNIYEFTIGTGSAIENFENAVLGMTLNSEKEITFTFPEDYSNIEEYAGKEATFKFKLIMHQEPPELTNDLCYRYTSYVNTDVMREMFEQEIIYSEFWNSMYENSVLKNRPENEYNEYYNGFIDVFKDYAKSNNKTLEEYVVTEGQNFPSLGLYQGITMDEFYKIAREYADQNVKNDLILFSLIKAEGLQTSGALYEAAQKQLLLSYGIGYTIDSLIEKYGREQITTSIMDIQVRKQILKYVTKTA